MAFAIFLVVIILCGWFWKARQYDKQTTINFDHWVSEYEAASSPLKESRMAVAFLNQSIHFAWTMGAISSREREEVTSVMKSQRASNTMMMWLGSALPVVTRVIDKEELSNTPARAVGMLMLLAWMSPESERENAIRQFLYRR